MGRIPTVCPRSLVHLIIASCHKNEQEVFDNLARAFPGHHLLLPNLRRRRFSSLSHPSIRILYKNFGFRFCGGSSRSGIRKEEATLRDS